MAPHSPPASSSAGPSRSSRPTLPVDLLLAAHASSSANAALARQSTSAESQRASVACLECRKLKSRCHRVPGADATQPCRRCENLGLACEIVRSRRGRKPGSRNKRVGLEKSLAHVQAALDRIRDQVDSGDEDAHDSPHGHSSNSADTPGRAGPNKRRRGSGSVAAASSHSPRHHKREHHDHHDHDREEHHDHLELPGGELPLDESKEASPARDVGGDGEHIDPFSMLSNIGHTARSAAAAAAAAGETPDAGGSAAGGGGGPGTASSTGGAPVPPHDVRGWTHAELVAAAQDRVVYFGHRLATAKRDLMPGLDPVELGIVSEEQAVNCVNHFFAVLQPQFGFMDASIYTLPAMRERSSLLTTAIIATGAAQTWDVPGSKALADKLYNHAERLILLIVSQNAKSCEIVDALLALSLWPRCPKRMVDDRSRMLLALAINMALELGLHREHPCAEGADEEAQKWHRDRSRTWLACIIQNRSVSAFSGKPPMLDVDLDWTLRDKWLREPHSTTGDRMLVAFLELRSIESDVRGRLRKLRQEGLEPLRHSYAVEAVRAAASAKLEGWVAIWVSPELALQSPLGASTMRVLAHHVHLVVTTATDAPLAQIVHTAQSSLEFVLGAFGNDARYICRTVCGMITWAAVVLLRADREASTGLVRDVALALAPFGDGRLNLTYAHFYGSFLLGLTDVAELRAAGLDPKTSSIPTPGTMAAAARAAADAGKQQAADAATDPSATAPTDNSPTLADAPSFTAQEVTTSTSAALSDPDPLAQLLLSAAGAGTSAASAIELPWDALWAGNGGTSAAMADGYGYGGFGNHTTPALEWLLSDGVNVGEGGSGSGSGEGGADGGAGAGGAGGGGGGGGMGGPGTMTGPPTGWWGHDLAWSQTDYGWM